MTSGWKACGTSRFSSYGEARAYIDSIKAQVQAVSVDMILYCPHCHVQHIDRPDRDIEVNMPGTSEVAFDMQAPWQNPPHHKHLCRVDDGGCGRTWTPARINTNGVRELP